MSTKSFFLKSKTVLGGIITALPVLGPLIGIGIDDVHLIGQVADQGVTLFGLLMTVYGRAKAASGIKFLPDFK